MFYKYFNIRMCTKMIKVTNKYNANYFYKKGYNYAKMTLKTIDAKLNV